MISLRIFKNSKRHPTRIVSDEYAVPLQETERRSTNFIPYCLSITLLLLVLIVIPGTKSLVEKSRISRLITKPCREPVTRREWRTLGSIEQQEYITAVQCLMNRPSIFNSETSEYDDFVFTHAKAGKDSHYAAAFLAWHRNFIHEYEKALRKDCSYSGYLPYWDWALDWQNLTEAPVWDPISGFGGDGDDNGQVILYEGRCVIKGFFANKTRYYIESIDHDIHEIHFKPHCFSRGFTKNESLLQDIRSALSPGNIEATLNQTDYFSFFSKFETGAHNAIPNFVQGDFLTFTAPNDPIFWLHHAQVDRLWWMWQQRDLKTRIHEFHGPANDFRYEWKGEASLGDLLKMAGLAPDRVIKDVLSTESNLLCYRY